MPPVHKALLAQEGLLDTTFSAITYIQELSLRQAGAMVFLVPKSATGRRDGGTKI